MDFSQGIYISIQTELCKPMMVPPVIQSSWMTMTDRIESHGDNWRFPCRKAPNQMSCLVSTHLLENFCGVTKGPDFNLDGKLKKQKQNHHRSSYCWWTSAFLEIGNHQPAHIVRSPLLFDSQISTITLGSNDNIIIPWWNKQLNKTTQW